jgi:hypothetical protein
VRTRDDQRYYNFVGKAKVLLEAGNRMSEIIIMWHEIIKSISRDLGREMEMGSSVYDRVILINRDGNMRDQHNYFEVL